jgi:uncharacterized protein YbcI
MTDPTLVFTEQRDGRSQLVVNFGVFSGREATEAEIFRLGQSLLGDLESIEIVAERRFEFDHETEAMIHQVRILLPRSADGRLEELSERVEDWARESIGERSIAP